MATMLWVSSAMTLGMEFWYCDDGIFVDVCTGSQVRLNNLYAAIV
jgi:hypothetical protein